MQFYYVLKKTNAKFVYCFFKKGGYMRKFKIKLPGLTTNLFRQEKPSVEPKPATEKEKNRNTPLKCYLYYTKTGKNKKILKK